MDEFEIDELPLRRLGPEVHDVLLVLDRTQVGAKHHVEFFCLGQLISGLRLQSDCGCFLGHLFKRHPGHWHALLLKEMVKPIALMGFFVLHERIVKSGDVS